MLSKTRVSRLPLQRAACSGFNQGSASSISIARILHKASISCPYSTTPSDSKETPLSTLHPLPEQSEWRRVFNPPGSPIGLRERVSIRNPETARTLAEGFTNWTKPLLKADEAMGKGKAAKGAPKTIIEAFPGAVLLYCPVHILTPLVAVFQALGR